MSKYKALVTEEISENTYKRSIQELDTINLPDNDVLIKVQYSSLNFKDALSARGHKGITRKYPHTPGIDAAGVVTESKSIDFQEGDQVIVTGYDLGMNTAGGFGQYISVPASWVVKLPDGLSLRESMMYGTAGFTSAICINEIISKKIKPGNSEILVTGATGGVGITAVGMLNKIGYNVIASTGKTDFESLLMEIGATKVINRSEVHDKSQRPLLSARWDAVVDTVGGNTLSTVIRSTKMHGLVCILGNVESDILNVSVYPFLLRGVNIAGIDSASKDMELRNYLWKMIASEWKIENLENYIKEVKLENLSGEIDVILRGGQFGRILVNLID